MKLSFIQRGNKGVVEEQARREERKKLMKNKLFRFFLPKDGTEVDLRFLTEEAMVFYEHVIRDGSDFYQVTCTQDSSCSHCKSGDRPQYVAAWLIWDDRAFTVKERDAQGKETGKTREVAGSVKPLVRGITDAAVIIKKSEKFTLMDRPYTAYKTGEGKGSRWNFDHGDLDPLSEKEIKEMLATLPEGLRGLTADEVLEHQIVPEEYLEASPAKSKKPAASSSRLKASKSVSSYDDEEDEEEQPKKSNTATTKKKLLKRK